MRTKLLALAVLGLIAGGTALAITLTGRTAQADTPTVAAPAQAIEAAGCCVTGDCCCPGQGACCDPAAKAKAATTTKSVKTGAGCCATGDCCCPGQGSCCADTATVGAKPESKACCVAK